MENTITIDIKSAPHQCANSLAYAIANKLSELGVTVKLKTELPMVDPSREIHLEEVTDSIIGLKLNVSVTGSYVR